MRGVSAESRGIEGRVVYRRRSLTVRGQYANVIIRRA